MRWTRVTAIAAGLALLPGCAVWIDAQSPAILRYAGQGRPTPSYYCYDCHGDRYLDPYYDFCPGRGFRYAWDRHPETVRVYRERYVRIREQNPSYGRYRYRTDYRDQRRYREPVDYESWRVAPGSPKPSSPERMKVRDRERPDPGKKTKQPRKWGDRDRSGPPRNARPPEGSRPGFSGGA